MKMAEKIVKSVILTLVQHLLAQNEVDAATAST
jgi:hypothetical protein